MENNKKYNSRNAGEKLPEVLERIGRNDGMTVPEGYFADFATRMEGMLPLNLEAEAPEKAYAQQKRSLWMRVRPYVYMAAMFAGVFCMTKMFGLMGETDSLDMRIDRNPVMIAALSNQEFVEDYLGDSMSEAEILDDMWESGLDATDFEDL
ncbi:MAG: hypothetical protein OSJ34_01970 [Muribaculaceae bacterium]|nr:hypothetical protein [Muribaculaceae bacterium]